MREKEMRIRILTHQENIKQVQTNSCLGRRFFVMLACMLMSASMAFAQKEKVSGTVFEAETGEPLVGVTVKVDGTNNGQ